MSNNKKACFLTLFIICLIVIDQITKYWVKTHMALGDSIHVTDWFYILFTENNGMAFGWEMFSKNFLTIFRLIAMGVIIYVLYKILKYDKSVKFGFILTLGAILAGAMGNIIDSVFYGRLFSHSHNQIAEFLPKSGGYAPLLHGKVVDMLYFPLIDSYWPDWVPFWGGEKLIFFRPIFNIADSCISVGAFVLILFYLNSLGKVFDTLDLKTEKNKSIDSTTSNDSK